MVTHKPVGRDISNCLLFVVVACTATAAVKPGAGVSEYIDHSFGLLACSLVEISLAGSPGASETSKLSSGIDSPMPRALIQDSLRVQQL